MASSDSEETAALLAAIKEPLPAAKRLTPREQAALSNRLYLSLDTEGRSLKERQQESAEKLQASYSGLFQPRSSHRARSPTRVREAEQEAEGEAGVLRLVSLCGRGEWTAVRELLQASLDLGGMREEELNGIGRGGVRPLHLACAYDAEAAELLLVVGAEVELADDQGARALHVAAAVPSERLVRLLLSAAAARGRGGAHGLHGAASPNVADRRGRTPLHAAAVAEARATAAAAAVATSTPAVAARHLAAAAEARRCGEVLLAHGADPLTRDDCGHTASELAPVRESTPFASAADLAPAAEATLSPPRRVQLAIAQPAAGGAAGGGGGAASDTFNPLDDAAERQAAPPEARFDLNLSRDLSSGRLLDF